MRHIPLIFACVCRLALAGERPAEVVNPQTEQPPAIVLDLDVLKKPRAELVAPTETVDASKPRAIILADGAALLGGWLRLDGSESIWPQDFVSRYEWKQLRGPALGLTSRASPQLWLFLVQPGEYRLALRVGTETEWSAPSEVKFKVSRDRAVANPAEARKFAGAGERVTLLGKAWLQIAGPEIDLRADAFGISFRPNEAGCYLFESGEESAERRGFVVPATRDGKNGDRRPIAEMLKLLNGTTQRAMVLDGSRSTDPDFEDSQHLTARWTTSDKDRGVELRSTSALKAIFRAARPGNYSVTLVVSDGRLDSEPETAFIEVTQGNGEPDAAEIVPRDEPEEIMRDDARFRKVSLGLYGTLDRAVQMFPSRCQVALRVDPEVAVAGRSAGVSAAIPTFEEVPLALEISNGPLLHLIDWLARQTDTCYRREGNRAFWLTKPLGWLKDEKPESVVALVDALHAKDDGSDLLGQIYPIFKPIIQATPGASLAYEKNRQELFGVLPRAASMRLKEIVAALREPAGVGLPQREWASLFEGQFRKLLAEKRVTFHAKHQRIDYLIRDFAKAAGLAMAFDPRQFGNTLPHVDFDADDVPLREACRTLVDAAGFDGCSVEPPSGLWFYRGGTPFPSGELLWDQAYVRAYDVSGLLNRVSPLTGEIIVHAIRGRIYPASWKDPATGLFYHASTHKLLVLHGQAAHAKVIDFLYDLSERGAWALGAAE